MTRRHPTGLPVLVAGLLIFSALACGGGGGSDRGSPPPMPYEVTFALLPQNGSLVNTPFAVAIDITDRATGLPATFSPAETFSLGRVGGSGNFQGPMVASVTSSPHVFSSLRYDYPDSLTIQATSAVSDPAASPPIRFEVILQANPPDLGAVPPGAPIPPVDFTLIDGPGNPFPHTGSLQWSLIDLGTGQPVQSGTEPFGGGAVATVSLASTTTESFYELVGDVQGAVSQVVVPLEVSSLILEDKPGPFVALKSARVGQTYLDDVSFAVQGAFEYGVLSGTIPPGITLDTSTGVLSGTPTGPANGEFVIFAKTAAFYATPIRCALAVFAVGETEWVPGQRFVAAGPYPTFSADDSATFTSSFDGNVYTTALRIHYPNPAAITPPIPLFVHHRGWGFNYQEYNEVLSRIAAYGFVCVSVEDYQSYFSPGSPAPDPFYNNNRIDAGMESGSAFHQGAIEHMLARSGTPGDLFEGIIDETKVFVGGHSRGGGATHGSHTRGLEMKINGVVYFMPVDLRLYSWTIPPGVSPSYPIPDIQPRLPSLMILAEEDGDTRYPFADQMIERVSGQATSVTVYGANHANLADMHIPIAPDAFPYISRQEQHDIIVNQVVAFLKRWGELDLSLEGFFYGNEHAGSTEIGVASLRNMVGAILVDDYQDGNPGTNLLGEANAFTGGSRVEASIYPFLSGFWIHSLGIQNNILTFTQTSATYSTGIPPATDLGEKKRLFFRCGQTSLQGYDWVTFQVQLTDSAGQSAAVMLFDRNAPAPTYFPDYITADPRVFDRFLEVQVPLADFTGINPALDLNSLASIDFLFDFASIPTAAEQVYLDDIRFE